VSAVRSAELADYYMAWVSASVGREQAKAREYVELRDKAPGLVVFAARCRVSWRLARTPWTSYSDPDYGVAEPLAG
jgi:hypothetical protein